MTKSSDILEIRNRIDAIDDQVLELLKNRIDCAKSIGSLAQSSRAGVVARMLRLSTLVTGRNTASSGFIASDPVTNVQCNNSCREVVVAAALKTCVFHHRLERLLVWVHANRLGEVLVTVRIIGDEFSERRQYLE